LANKVEPPVSALSGAQVMLKLICRWFSLFCWKLLLPATWLALLLVMM